MIKPESYSNRNITLHLISDATGETLITLARAAMVYYPAIKSRECVHALVHSGNRLNDVCQSIDHDGPGAIVLFTLSRDHLVQQLTQWCHEHDIVCIDVLAPVLDRLALMLGKGTKPRASAQHGMTENYFSRIAAMDFTINHDDGQNLQTLGQADIILLGISRTSKTPTSIYLANKGFRTANIPLIPGQPPPPQLDDIDDALIVGLIATSRRIAMFRSSRLATLGLGDDTDYIDMGEINREMGEAKALFKRKGWAILDVTRCSIEETAASIMAIYHSEHRAAESGAD